MDYFFFPKRACIWRNCSGVIVELHEMRKYQSSASLYLRRAGPSCSTFATRIPSRASRLDAATREDSSGSDIASPQHEISSAQFNAALLAQLHEACELFLGGKPPPCLIVPQGVVRAAKTIRHLRQRKSGVLQSRNCLHGG